MSEVNLVELKSPVNAAIKEDPFNHEDKVESTGNPDSNCGIKLEVEDHNLEDLHHVVDIKDGPLETRNQETQPVYNHEFSCSFSEEEIISVVSKKPTLWNPYHDNYGSGITVSTWGDVAQELGVSGEGFACKEKWDSIQEQYKSFKQSGEDRQHVKRKQYFDKLRFLDPYLSFSQTSETAAPYLLSAAEQNLNCQLSNDSVIAFYSSVGNKVMKFPPDLQIEATRGIFKIIADCQLMAQKGKSNQ